MAVDIARRAADELTQRLPDSPEVRRLMIDRLAHPDQAVRQAAQEHVGQTSFQRFWSQYQRLPEEVRQFAAQKLRRIVPDLVDRLAGKLASSEPADRLQACGSSGSAGTVHD